MHEQRITPAYAGTTRFLVVCVCLVWDHPRLRGNYMTIMGGRYAGMGSPPLTRELLSVTNCHSIGQKDHPRLRGNYFLNLRMYFRYLGSPPLTRELHFLI